MTSAGRTVDEALGGEHLKDLSRSATSSARAGVLRGCWRSGADL